MLELLDILTWNFVQTFMIPRGWLYDNRLSLHLGQAQSILFGTRLKLRISPNFEVKCGQSVITAQTKVYYLGCVIDNILSGDDMAMKAHNKITNRTKFLARNANILDSATLKTLPRALVLCHFDYAATFWYSGTAQSLKNKLQTAQNKLIRAVLKLHPRTHLDSVHFRMMKKGWYRLKWALPTK